MGTELDERALGDVLAKLVEGKGVEASALLANALVTVLSIQFLGPLAPAAGKVTEAAIKRFADLVGRTTRDFLEAGKKLDDERAAREVLQEALTDALERVRAEDADRFEELGDQGQEQFLQLITFTRRNVVEKLDRLLKQTAETHEIVKEIHEVFAREVNAAARGRPTTGVPLLDRILEALEADAAKNPLGESTGTFKVLAEKVGSDWDTVYEAMLRLRDEGWIGLDIPGGWGEDSTFEVRLSLIR